MASCVNIRWRITCVSCVIRIVVIISLGIVVATLQFCTLLRIRNVIRFWNTLKGQRCSCCRNSKRLVYKILIEEIRNLMDSFIYFRMAI